MTTAPSAEAMRLAGEIEQEWYMEDVGQIVCSQKATYSLIRRIALALDAEYQRGRMDATDDIQGRR